MSEHVTIVRSGRIGDVTLILPAVRALQARGAQVTWLIQADSHRLVQHITDIDWHVMTGGLVGGRRLRAAIPPHSRVCLLEAPTVETGIAVCGRHCEDLSGQVPQTLHAIQHYWERLLGVIPGPADRAHWGLTETVTSEPGNTLLLNLCSSSELKDWTVEGYTAVIALARELERNVVVVHGGTPRERQVLERVRQRIHVADLACDLRELLELLAGACCLVSPDTGPLHLAGVVGTPVVGIYGYTRPAQWGPYWSMRWTAHHAGKTAQLPVPKVLECLRRLANDGYPRAGGEGASL